RRGGARLGGAGAPREPWQAHRRIGSGGNGDEGRGRAPAERGRSGEVRWQVLRGAALRDPAALFLSEGSARESRRAASGYVGGDQRSLGEDQEGRAARLSARLPVEPHR